MRRLFISLMVAVSCFLPDIVQSKEIVKVGGYEFQPFVEYAQDGQPRGVTVEMIKVLNNVQDTYEFRFVPTSSRRRYAELNEGKFDLIFFESPEWDWVTKAYPVDFSRVFLNGGEVFVSLSKPGRGQDWFSSLQGKKMVGILGYHYGFANFNADPDVLKTTYNMKLVGNQRSSIDMVLADRMDVAVVTDSYLWAYLRDNPDAKSRILVSDRYDQTYSHRVLVRRGGPIGVDAVNRLLDGMERDGSLDRLWKATGVAH